MSRYDDIINLPHHQSPTRPHMSLHDRAAQFAPFAALVGYDAQVSETARLTDQRITLTESKKAEINAVVLAIAQCLPRRPMVRVVHFVEDQRKDGGAYVDYTGRVKKLNEYEKTILFEDGSAIRIEDVAELSFADEAV